MVGVDVVPSVFVFSSVALVYESSGVHNLFALPLTSIVAPVATQGAVVVSIPLHI